MTGQYETFRGFELGAGLNLKHDPALVGPAFAQKADNVANDENTIKHGNGWRRLLNSHPEAAAIELGDLNIHLGDVSANEPGDAWNNFGPTETTGFDYLAESDLTTDPTSPVLPGGTNRRPNYGTAGRFVAIPYRGTGLSRTLASGTTIRLGVKLAETFRTQAMRPGHGFPLFQVGGAESDRFCGLCFGLQLVSAWPGYSASSQPSGLSRKPAALVPFVLFNDGSTKQTYARKLMWDYAVRPGARVVFTLRFSSTHGTKLFADGVEVPMFGSTRKFDTAGDNYQVCESVADRAISYGIGQADSAVILGHGGVIETHTKAMYGITNIAVAAGTTTTIETTSLATTDRVAGWLIHCKTDAAGATSNISQFRWCSRTSVNGANLVMHFDQAWTQAPGVGDVFEGMPVVWSRYERGSDEPAYASEFMLSDVMAIAGDRSDAQIAAWGSRGLTESELRDETGVLFYLRGDRGDRGVVEDSGPFGNHGYMSGRPGNRGGLFLDGSRTSLYTAWGSNKMRPNKTMDALMSKLLSGDAVTTSAASNKQYGFRMDFSYWNNVADYGHYVLAQQGTSDPQYKTHHHTPDYASNDHVGDTYNAYIWQLVLVSGNHGGTGTWTNPKQQKLKLYWRHTDPTNDSSAVAVNEFVASLDLNAFGFDISGKRVSVRWGLINPNTSIVTTPSANGRLWLRLYHEGVLVGTATTAVSFAAAPNGDDYLWTPYDELVIGRALQTVAHGTDWLARMGNGYCYAPIQVHGAWVMPGVDSFGGTMDGVEITPGVGRDSRFLGDLGNSGSLVDLESDSTTVTSHGGDNFAEELAWEANTYGLQGMYLYAEALSKTYFDPVLGNQAYTNLVQVSTVSGPTITLREKITGASSDGALCRSLRVAFGGRAGETEMVDDSVIVPSSHLGCEDFGVYGEAVKDEGPFVCHFDVTSTIAPTYAENGRQYARMAPGFVQKSDNPVHKLAEFRRADEDVSRKVACIGGVFGEVDDGWRKGSYFYEKDGIDQTTIGKYSLRIDRGRSKNIAEGTLWREVDGPPSRVWAEARTGTELAQDMTFEADVLLDSIDGDRTIFELGFGTPDAATVVDMETYEGKNAARFYVEAGVPKFSYSTAAANTAAVFRPNARVTVTAGRWTMLNFVHGATINDCHFIIDGRLVAAVLESGAVASSFTANAGSYVSGTGFWEARIGVARAFGGEIRAALGGQIARLAYTKTRKWTADYSPEDVIGESATTAQFYYKFTESRGASIADFSSSANHNEVFGSGFHGFLATAVPSGSVAITPFGGKALLGHHRMYPHMYDGSEALPLGFGAMPFAPSVDIHTETISTDDGGGVHNGAEGKNRWFNNTEANNYGYEAEGVSNPCGLNVRWNRRVFRFGGNTWLEADPDEHFALGRGEDRNTIVLQGFIRPTAFPEDSSRMIVVDARNSTRDGWALETNGRRLRFTFWDVAANRERWVETRKNVLTQNNWHYFYFRYRVNPDTVAGAWDVGAGAWSDTADVDSFVVVDLTKAWTYVRSIAVADLVFGEDGYVFYEDNAPTPDLVSLRIGGNPLASDPYSKRQNFVGEMDTIQGQIQDEVAEIKIKRLFVGSNWAQGGRATSNTNASGNWAPINQTFPDIARPDLQNDDENWAWSFEETEGGQNKAFSRVNIGVGVPGACTIDQYGSFLSWKAEVKTNEGSTAKAGSHQFAITLYDPETGMESPPTRLATSIVPEENGEGVITVARWRIENLPIFPGTTRAVRRIWKTPSNNTALFLAQVVGDSTSTQCEITASDAFLTGSEQLVLGRFSPPRCSIIHPNENSVFYAGIADSPETIAFSAPGAPWSLPYENQILDEEGDGTAITALHYFRGSLDFFTKRSVYGTTVREYGHTTLRLNNASGAVGSGAVVDDGEEILVIGSRGFYRGEQAETIRYEGEVLDSFFRDEFDYRNGHLVHSVYDRTTGVLFMLVPTRGDKWPKTILRGYKTDFSMGSAIAYDQRKTSRYTWTKLVGPQYTAIAECTDVDGSSAILAGNPYGGIGYLEGDARIGLETDVGYSGFHQAQAATVTLVSGKTLTVSGTLLTRGAGLTGSTIVLGGVQANITKNSATTIEVDRTGLVAGAGVLGAVLHDWWSGWIDFASFEKRKRAYWLDLQFTTATTNTVTVEVYTDFSGSAAKTFTRALDATYRLELPIGELKARYFSFRIRYSGAGSNFELLRAGVRLASNAEGGHVSDVR